MRLFLSFLGIILFSASCTEKEVLTTNLRSNLIGEWEYILATTQIGQSGVENTYYREGWIHINEDGTGEESTLFSINSAFEWSYQNDPPKITKIPVTIISVVDTSVTYDITIYESEVQEWYNESTFNNDKIIDTWSLTKK